MSQPVPSTPRKGLLSRLGRFLRKPWAEQVRNACLFSREIIPSMPIPIRLPIGCWWLAWNNHLGDELLADGFEEPEYAFVQRFLKEGMVVLDVGANEGITRCLLRDALGVAGSSLALSRLPGSAAGSS